MIALTKFSIALLLITASAIAAYLLLAPSDEGFDATGSQPRDATSFQSQDGICKQDEERLARLRANPSLDEGLSFVSEIRCLRLWPQLQTIMDGFANSSRQTATSRPSGPDAIPTSDIALAPGTTSTPLGDACKRDEDRLAELRANPSVQAAVRFDSELQCPRLRPQLPAILSQLSKTAKVEAANQLAAAPATMSTGVTTPPAASPSALEVASAASDDGCKRDEARLVELQAQPSRDEAVRFEDELKCSRLQPQVMALLDSLSQAPQSAGTPTPNGAPTDTTSTGGAAPPASDPAPEAKSASRPLSPSEAPSSATTAAETSPPASASTTDARDPAAALNLNGAPPDKVAADAVTPRASEPPVSEVTSGAGAPSSGEAPLNAGSAGAADTNSTGEATTHPSRPGLQALTGNLANEPPTQIGSISNDERGTRNAVNDTQPPSQAIADADRRIAALESDKDSPSISEQTPAGERGRRQPASPVSSATEDAIPVTSAVSHDASRETKPADSVERSSALPARTDVAAGMQLAALAPDETCQRDEARLAQLRGAPSRDEISRFANELGCARLRPQVLSLMESLAPTPSRDAATATPPGAQVESEGSPASPPPPADVASSESAETCKRDEERLARLGSNPSGDEALRFVKELSCEKLLPQLQRLLHSPDFEASAPRAPAYSAHLNPLLGQTCASERAALDRLRQEPSAETVGLFWRDLQCEGLRPQVRLLMESLNVSPDSVGSAAAPGEPEGRGATSDTPTAIETDPTCRQERAELNRVRSTPDLSGAKRFANGFTCGALKPQVARLLESLGE
jgi:hypothetical protein